MADNLRKSSLAPFLVTGTLLLICVGLEYWLHIVYGVTYIYPHTFYIPIIAAAIWWGLKGGLGVGLFLGLMHLVSFWGDTIQIAWFESLAFVVVGCVAGIVVDRRKREEEVLKQSEKKSGFRVLFFVPWRKSRKCLDIHHRFLDFVSHPTCILRVRIDTRKTRMRDNMSEGEMPMTNGDARERPGDSRERPAIAKIDWKGVRI